MGHSNKPSFLRNLLDREQSKLVRMVFLQDQAVLIMVAKRSKSTPTSMICSTTSLKLTTCKVDQKLHSESWFHIVDNNIQDHRACTTSSGSIWQCSQMSFVIIFQCLRLTMVGIQFLMAHHKKFLIFG